MASQEYEEDQEPPKKKTKEGQEKKRSEEKARESHGSNEGVAGSASAASSGKRVLRKNRDEGCDDEDVASTASSYTIEKEDIDPSKIANKVYLNKKPADLEKKIIYYAEREYVTNSTVKINGEFKALNWE